MNNIAIKGRITADVEINTTSSGIEFCLFSVAVDRRGKKDAEKITDFIPCKAWRQTAVFVSQYFNKGQEIIILGELHIDKYEKDGENRSFSYVNVQNVEFCGSKVQTAVSSNNAVQDSSNVQVPEDDDLPF